MQRARAGVCRVDEPSSNAKTKPMCHSTRKPKCPVLPYGCLGREAGEQAPAACTMQTNPLPGGGLHQSSTPASAHRPAPAQLFQLLPVPQSTAATPRRAAATEPCHCARCATCSPPVRLGSGGGAQSIPHGGCRLADVPNPKVTHAPGATRSRHATPLHAARSATPMERRPGLCRQQPGWRGLLLGRAGRWAGSKQAGFTQAKWGGWHAGLS